MEATLVDSFAKRLDSISPHSVKAVGESSLLLEAEVLICSYTSRLMHVADGFRVEHVPQFQPGYNPNIDLLFESAALHTHAFGILAILLTGIGSDGAAGLLALRQKGAETIAESEESAIVYGMPRSACEMSAVQKSLPLHDIIREITRFDSRDV
jgi:two-component system chemotaxis response regulator CheB